MSHHEGGCRTAEDPRIQFLGESVLLASLGGIGEAVLGGVVTASFRGHPRRAARPTAWMLVVAAAATILVLATV